MQFDVFRVEIGRVSTRRQFINLKSAIDLETRALEAKVWPLLAAGKVRVVMDSTFPLAKAADAHRRLESGAHVGKVVLVV